MTIYKINNNFLYVGLIHKIQHNILFYYLFMMLYCYLYVGYHI